jgi:hypothetical protein
MRAPSNNRSGAREADEGRYARARYSVRIARFLIQRTAARFFRLVSYMKRYRLPIVGVVLSLSTTMALAATWTLLYEEELNNVGHVTHMVDMSSLSKHGELVSAWVLTNYSKVQSLRDEDHTYKTYRSDKELIYIKCEQRKLATVVDQIWTEPMAKGRLLNEEGSIFATDATSLHWQDATVWPFVAAYSDRLCK